MTLEDCVGFDNCWIYDENDGKKPVFSIWSVNSGIKCVFSFIGRNDELNDTPARLDVTTNQPALQVRNVRRISS